MQTINKTVKELEDSIIRRTNKYVYFNDGTHMSHSDFHKLKTLIRNEHAIVHKKQFENSIELAIVKLTTLQNMEMVLKAEAKVDDNDDDTEPSKADYEKWWREEQKRSDKLNSTVYKAGRLLYKNLHLLPELNTYQAPANGIKFIIQKHRNQAEYRFCFDPFELTPNFHSSINELYASSEFYTENGGWMKTIGNTVVLYAKSGDYGVYNDGIAAGACKALFPTRDIKSFAGKQWNDIADLFSDANKLPF